MWHRDGVKTIDEKLKNWEKKRKKFKWIDLKDQITPNWKFICTANVRHKPFDSQNAPHARIFNHFSFIWPSMMMMMMMPAKKLTHPNCYLLYSLATWVIVSPSCFYALFRSENHWNPYAWWYPIAQWFGRFNVPAMTMALVMFHHIYLYTIYIRCYFAFH